MKVDLLIIAKITIIVNTRGKTNVSFSYQGAEIDIKTDTVFDFVILQAKQFIYNFKLDKCLQTLLLPSTTDAEIQNR